MPTATQTRRAAPLPPEQRRPAILAAALPLLLEHGRDVTTRQLAEAAEVSEGTLFNVFADKDALIEAAIDAATDPAPFEAALRAIDADVGFTDRLVAATTIVQHRTLSIWRLLNALGARGTRPPRPLPESPALVALFESAPEQVRVEPSEAAHLLRALTLALSHPILSGGEVAGAATIVDTFLYGVAVGA